MSLAEVQELAKGLVGLDMDTACQSAEELVDLLLFLTSSEKPDRQEQIGAMEEVRAGLVHLLMNGSDDAQYWSCVALSYIAHRNANNIRRIGQTPRVFDGIFRALAVPECQSVACGVLSQLAFCNKQNSKLISETEGLLDRLVAVMRHGRPGDQQAATCALSNCAANSNSVALKIVAVPDMVQGLTELCGETASREASDSRTSVSAIGCMDNLSYYEEVRPKLQEEKVIDVLIPIMEGGISGHESSRVMAAESAMIVTRLTSKEDLMNLRVGKDVLSTIMHCLRCAIDGEQWANFAWRLGDVLEPLYRLSFNKENCLLMTGEGVCKELVRVLQLAHNSNSDSEPSPSTKRSLTEAGHVHCIQAICNIASYPSCFTGLKGVRAIVHAPMAAKGKVSRGDEWMFLTAADILENSKHKGSGLVGSNLWVLRERNIALLMSLHPRLGLASPFACMDVCVLREIIDISSTSGIASLELARVLRGGCGHFFGMDLDLKLPLWNPHNWIAGKAAADDGNQGDDAGTVSAP